MVGKILEYAELTSTDGIPSRKVLVLANKPGPIPPAPPVPPGEGDGNMENAFRVLFDTQGGSFISPSTGLSYGDTISQLAEQGIIIPDFIMDSADEDAQPILNSTHNHELHVSGDYQRLMKEQAEKGTPDQKREATFWLQKISSAQNFIMAIKQREKTMSDIMQAIYKFQKDFFITGDESTLKPMILKDVEELSGYDSSTVSRMSDKYIQTNDGLYPLKFFFSNRRVKVGGDDSGEYVFSKEVLDALRSLIDSEDKSSPYSDDRLSDMLKAQGFNIARRTVAKYRDRMGVPIARMRKRF